MLHPFQTNINYPLQVPDIFNSEMDDKNLDITIYKCTAKLTAVVYKNYENCDLLK